MTYRDLPLAYYDDLLVRMAHHSTAIEGNTLTQGETKSILIDGYIPRPMDMRELNEVLNYRAFMPFMRESLESSRAIDTAFIKESHRILCRDAIGGNAGEFKTTANMIIGADFTPTPPYMVNTAVHEWTLNLAAQMDAASSDIDRLEAICRQHIAFERIHPFSDGNGRVGRALIVYACLAYGMPPAVVPVDRRREYINYLNTNDLPSLLTFCKELQDREHERMKLFTA